MQIKTGFGILVKNGKKLRKYELHPGEHNIDPQYTIMEVGSRAELDATVLDKSDEQIQHESSMALQMNLRTTAKAKIKAVCNLSDDELNALFGV